MKHLQYIAVFSILIIAEISGCSSVEKQDSKNTESNAIRVVDIIAHYRGQLTLNLNNENLQNIPFEGETSVGATTIKYQKGLASQAQVIAEKVNDVFSHVESETGIEFKTHPHIYLMRVQKLPQNLDIVLNANDPNIYPMPMFAETGNDNPNSILAEDIYFPYALTHELTETSLMYPDKQGKLKIFHQTRFLIFITTFDDYTRWFREGFSNYAGYIALDYLRTNPDEKLSGVWDTALINQMPFTALDEVGDKLFKWEQNENQKIKGDYYGAALGLFLVLENKYGRESIKNIITELNNYEELDGHGLEKVIKKQLDIDIRQLASDFKFIKLGIHYSQLSSVLVLNHELEQEEGFYVKAVEPNSIAAKAGIDANDIIVEINNRPIKTRLDFELALFEAMEQSNTQCKIWRKDEGCKELQLALDEYKEIPVKKVTKKSGAAESTRHLSVVTGMVITDRK
ncbi:MAG: PDZ domain-containing protein [Sedimentisphaerales bacterium]|nr:PDZ domain-containing protein [Sedimentisphaerales bacterium]